MVTEQKIKGMVIGKDSGWNEIEEIVENLPRKREGKT